MSSSTISAATNSLPRRFSLRALRERVSSRSEDVLTNDGSRSSFRRRPRGALANVAVASGWKPRRVPAAAREEGIMPNINDSHATQAPLHFHPLALISKMSVRIEGTVFTALHHGPGAPRSFTKWISRSKFTRFYAEARGNLVLLCDTKGGAVREIFSPVGSAVSSADTVVNRKGAVEHNVNISKNGYTLQLRFPSEIEAERWADVLRIVSLTRQPRLRDFQMIAPIGEGASGKVFLVRDVKTGRKLALKCMRKSSAATVKKPCDFRHAVDERLAHEAMNSTNYIVGLRHAFQTRESFYLATDFCEGGDVYTFVDKHGGGVSEELARIITAQVLLGLRSLHKKSVVFRDLKPENVLLDNRGRVRLADFGLCKFLDPTVPLTRTVCGTFSYAAAEILAETGYGFSCDLWALGTFLYHIMIGRPPRVAVSLQEARNQVFASKEPIIWYNDIMSEQAISLVTSLIETNPERRLGCGPQGITEVCSHPFFRGIDWEALSNGETPSDIMNELPEQALGDLRNFDQEEWRSIRMDPDQDDPAFTESSLWPPLNLATQPIPADFLVAYSYSVDMLGTVHPQPSGGGLIARMGSRNNNNNNNNDANRETSKSARLNL